MLRHGSNGRSVNPLGGIDLHEFQNYYNDDKVKMATGLTYNHCYNFAMFLIQNQQQNSYATFQLNAILFCMALYSYNSIQSFLQTNFFFSFLSIL